MKRISIAAVLLFSLVAGQAIADEGSIARMVQGYIPAQTARVIDQECISSVGANLVPGANASYDLGTSAKKWRDAYVSRNETVGGTLGVTGAATLSGGATIGTGKTFAYDVGTLAAAGSVQGDAALIAAQVTYVTASDGAKGVILPVGANGEIYQIINTVSGSLLKIYPATGGAINGGSANAAITLTGGATAKLIKVAANTWYAGLDPDPTAPVGYSPPVAETVAAAGTGVQGDCAALSATKYVHYVTGNAAGKSVCLPAATAADIGKTHYIIPKTQAAINIIFPASGGAVNDGAANASFTAGVATAAHPSTCIVTATNQWYCG